MPPPIGPTSPVNLPTVHRADGMDGHDMSYWLSHPADALDEIDRIECEESLYAFVKRMWHILEPANPMVHGWVMEAICEHLQAVTNGDIQKLVINVPPGFSKSLITNVFWPAWEWGPKRMPHLRYVTFSYTASLTERDNRRFRDVILSHDFSRLFGGGFDVLKAGEQLVSNSKTGWKLATSISGVGTGERGDRVINDDLNNVKDSESPTIRDETNRWIREGMSNRLNDAAKSAVVNIQQRTNEQDATGTILEHMPEFHHLMIPMEWDGRTQISTVPNMVWNEDPREKIGDLAWPQRFNAVICRNLKTTVGPFAWAGQYQQSPTPRGGGIIRRDWWQLWDPPPTIMLGADGEPREVQKFPDCEFIVASFDGAFGQKQENDWSALTVWGVFRQASGVLASSTRTQRPYLDQVMNGRTSATQIAAPVNGQPPQVMLMHAWRKRLPLNGYEITREDDETDAEFKARQMREWGIVQWVIHTCKRFGVNMLLVEAKANGIDVANETKRQMEGQRFGVKLIDPGKLDKVARAYAVQHIWADRMVWYPDREWAEDVINEAATFPKGGHDDLTDTSTQAIKYLRDIGVLLHGHEMERELAEAMQYKSQTTSRPLYPV